jgi:hypothetical protein
MRGIFLVTAIGVSAATLGAAYADKPAWCGETNGFANSEDFSRLQKHDYNGNADELDAIVDVECSDRDDVSSRRGEVEALRAEWSKRLGMSDTDWADVVDHAANRRNTLSMTFDYSAKDFAQFSPTDQYHAIANGPGGSLYNADAFDPHMTETGRMGFIEWCLTTQSVADKYGDITKWAICWPDIEKFDSKKVFAELKADKTHPGVRRTQLRLKAYELPAQIQQVVDRKAAFVKSDAEFQTVFDAAKAARDDWAKTTGTDTALLDLALAADGAAFFHSRKLLDGCADPTEAALAKAMTTIPAKSFLAMHDYRMYEKPGFAQAAAPVLVATPAVNLAATAYAECHDKTGIADYLSSFLQWVPIQRGPRNAALIALREMKFKFDDTTMRPLGFPGANGPLSRTGGTIMSDGGVVKSIKTNAKDNTLTVALEKTSVTQQDCVKEHRTNRISEIRSDGSIAYEVICDQSKAVTHDTTLNDFTIADSPALDKVLKPGVVFSALHWQSAAEVIAIWPNKTAKTPSWVLGGTVK